MTNQTMKRVSLHRRFTVGVVFALFGGLVATSHAVEPATEFLQALRQNGYHELALEYLDRMQTSSMAPVTLKQTIDYERGLTLLEASREQRDMSIREKQLDEAKVVLDRFVTKNPNHPLSSAANSQLGNLLVERARIKVEQSKKRDKATNLAEAAQLYSEARKLFDDILERIRADLERLPKVIPKTAKAQIDLRDQLRRDYLQAQLLAAAIVEEMADTKEPGSKEHTAALEQAAKEYGEIYEKYRTRLAGLYAEMYQARCYNKLKKYKDALTLIGELLEQPDEHPAFRTLKTKTMLLAVEAWVESEPSLIEQAIDKGGAWVDGARPNEETDMDWQELRLKMAATYKQYADKQKGTDAKQARLNYNNGLKLAKHVAKFPGSLQKAAKELMAEFPGAAEGEDLGEPETFAEAKDAGKAALDNMQTNQLIVQKVAPRIAKVTDPKEKQDLQDQVQAAEEAIKQNQEDATKYFRIALKLADSKTSVDDVNIVRYFLTYLYYIRGDYLDAAVVGEFLARRYPESSGARQSAKIAMASYLKLYSLNESANKDFESRRSVDVCEYIVQKWPDQPEAAEALNTLIPFMIKDGHLDKAEAYLQQIAPDSPKRGESELKTGQAMWSKYLVEMRDENADKSGLEDLKARAKKTLADGVSRMQASGTVDDTLATAVLSLAQIYVDTGESLKGIEVMEDPNIGVLTLVKKGHPATQRPGFAQETFKTALRAYVSSLAGSPDPAATIQKAQDVMDAMKNAIEQDKLVAIYISLARDLESQMEIASADEKTALSQGFESFLSKVSQETTDFTVLNWVAETFFSLGKGFRTGTGSLSPEARDYYARAIEIYEKLLTAELPNPALKTQVSMRIAMTKRRMGKFVDAMTTFEEILAEKNMMLNVQVEAAQTYQDWGEATTKVDEKTTLFDRAIKGGKPGADNKYIVWGWGKIAKLTSGKEQFQNTFHQARYNLALARYMQAKAANDKEKLKLAVQDIRLTYRLYPELGGEAWRDKYEQLLRDVQKTMGDPPLGFAAFDTKTTSTP